MAWGLRFGGLMVWGELGFVGFETLNPKPQH